MRLAAGPPGGVFYIQAGGRQVPLQGSRASWERPQRHPGTSLSPGQTHRCRASWRPLPAGPGTVFYVTELPPWFAEALRHNEQLMRDAAQMIESFQQATEAARQIQQSHGLAPMFTSDATSAMDAGMAQLAEAVRGQALRVRWDVIVQPATVTATATFPAISVMTAEGTVSALACKDRLVDAQALALVLMWLVVLSMPAAQVFLPDDAQAILNSYCGAIALALTIQYRMNDKRKK